MARIPTLEREQLAEGERDIYDDLMARRGNILNLFKTLAHTPGLLRRLLAYSTYLRNETRLDPKLRELALMTVGRLARAEYEMTHHWNIALKVGVRREQLQALADYQHSALFNAQERAVMRYAEEATSNITVGDDTFAALRQFLDNEMTVELVQQVAFYNMVVRILMPLRIELEPDAAKG